MSHHLLPMARYGKSPMELLFGVKGRIPFLHKGAVEGSYSRMALEHLERHQLSLDKSRNDVLELEKRSRQKELAKVEKKRQECVFEPGDTAIVWAKGTKHKTECVWSDLVEIINRVNESTYTVRYPSNKQEDVPATRLKLVSPWDRSSEAAAGPFFDNYPRMVFEGASAGDVHEQKLGALPRMVVHPDLYQKTKSTPVKTKNRPKEPTHDPTVYSTEEGMNAHEKNAGSAEEGAVKDSGGDLALSFFSLE